jgi:hypothetical protein
LVLLLKKKINTKRRRFKTFGWKKKEKKKHRAIKFVFSVLRGFHQLNCIADPTCEPDWSSLRFAIWTVRLASPVFKILLETNRVVVVFFFFSWTQGLWTELWLYLFRREWENASSIEAQAQTLQFHLQFSLQTFIIILFSFLYLSAKLITTFFHFCFRSFHRHQLVHHSMVHHSTTWKQSPRFWCTHLLTLTVLNLD